MDGQQRKRRRTANKDLVGTTSLLQILSKNITAVKRAHELVNEADSEDEDSGVQKVLDNNKSKMIISAQRIIQSPRPSHSKKLADEERLVLRDLNIAIQLARDSEYPRDELQAKFDVLKGVFQHSTPSGTYLSNANNIVLTLTSI